MCALPRQDSAYNSGAEIDALLPRLPSCILMKIQKLRHWVADYLYFLKGVSFSFWYRKPPAHYLGHTTPGKSPVVIIPGVMSTWHFMKNLADPISLRGHPLYVVKELGYNLQSISASAEIVRKLIDDKKLSDVILIGHSKGGLVGKHMLSFHNRDGKIRKLIAIATPFAGSKLAHVAPVTSLGELRPGSSSIAVLEKKKKVNENIVNIYGSFDNHIWPHESMRLEGAKNICLDIKGHTKILFDAEASLAVLAELES